jgi:uncharacterized phage protein (TIGR02220 family)
MTERKITKQDRKFEGVWIPAEFWLDENLSIMEVALLTEIKSLDNDKGCFASNAYLSSFFGLSKGRISQLVNQLKDKGYITIQYQREGKQIKQRVIRVVSQLNRGGIKYSKHPIKNTKQGYLENAKENSTSINNTVNSTEIYSQAEPDGVADKTKTIIGYLNEKTDSHYKATTPKTKRLVQARLKEGFTVDDFKTVIDKKTATWMNDNKMNKYLRPLTLFGTKFEDYLNEKVKGQPDKNDPYYTERINPMTGQPDPNGYTRYQMDNEFW